MPAIPFFFLATQGAEYDNTKLVYLSPQIAGFDFGLQWAPNTSNGYGISTGNPLNASITGAGIGTGSCCATAATSGCPNLSSGPGIQDGSRATNQTVIGVRYQGTFGGLGLLAYVDRPGGGQPGQHLRVEPARGPSAGDPSARGHRAVGEPVHLARARARPGPTSPTMTRPLVAPRSTAATRTACRRQRRNAAATPASTGMCSPVVWVRSGPAQGEHGVGDVLGQHLALEQRALGVELAESSSSHAVDRGALAPQPPAKMPEPLHDAVGVDAVDPDAVLAELGGEQPHLVGLVGLGRGVGDVVRAGEDRVLRGDVDDVAAQPLVDQHLRGGLRDQERALGHHVVLEVPVRVGGLEQRLATATARRC